MTHMRATRTTRSRRAVAGAALAAGALLTTLVGAQPGAAQEATSGTRAAGAAASVTTAPGTTASGSTAAGAAAPAAGPQLDVRRTTGLRDGDIATFRITGGPAKQYVWVMVCGARAATATCDDDTRRQFRVLPDGTYGPSPKKLYAQLETPSGKVDCRAAAEPCELALFDNSGNVLTSTRLDFLPDALLEAAPTFRISPNRDLLDGGSVTVTGRGYEPQYHFLVVQCAAGAVGYGDCTGGGRPPATDDKGRLKREVTVRAGFRTQAGRDIDCRPKGACELVSFASRVRGPESVRSTLRFDPSQPLPTPAP
ncbi:neocarzinostatin apoprotein domain-containing protein [Streptomyces sp. NPDC004111]|uniref:neocarzinostatin apoprotein domain-containing protein n=1 Tax=Streptomyces sp. NPDC004111 TaxID=3364690 RepID=UPI00367A9845